LLNINQGFGTAYQSPIRVPKLCHPTLPKPFPVASWDRSSIIFSCIAFIFALCSPMLAFLSDIIRPAGEAQQPVGRTKTMFRSRPQVRQHEALNVQVHVSVLLGSVQAKVSILDCHIAAN
jgi:hypothetical protein